VLSPSSITIDRRDKFKQYAKAGVQHYWIVDPQQRTIEGHVLSRGKYQLAGKGSNDETITMPPFEKLKILLSELWQPPG
jgi:Uma2 family endonuclease